MKHHAFFSSALKALLLLLLPALWLSCKPLRFVEEDKTMLRSMKIESESPEVKTSAYEMYALQQPNTRWFGFLKVPLSIYCISPADTARGKGRIFRKNGEPPVVYDPEKTEISKYNMEQALRAHGYLHAEVNYEAHTRKRKTSVTYHLRPAQRYYISDIDTICDNYEVAGILREVGAASRVRKGSPLDMPALQEERSRLVSEFQNRGYYLINKEFISFAADTLRDQTDTRLTLIFRLPKTADTLRAYQPFRYRRINTFLSDNDTLRDISGELSALPVRHRVFDNHLFIREDSLYNESEYQSTNSALNSLSAFSYSAVRLREVGRNVPLLDADVILVPSKPMTVGVELEGTNTNGDLGAAAAVTFAHRNLFRGSENLSLKLRGAYEAITGLEGYSGSDYWEFGSDLTLRLPSRRPPLFGTKRHDFRTTGILQLSFDKQDRPEFHRQLLTANWAYNMNNKDRTRRHRFDILSLNYIFMPWISETFRHEYLEGQSARQSILKASYENLLILSSAYTFTMASSQQQNAMLNSPAQQFRIKVETAGNLLYAFSYLTRAQKNSDNQYEAFNNVFSQYVRAEVDYARHIPLGEKSQFAFHAYFGIAVPYANSSVIPYEKRFFAGGANSLRGWSVRSLGPGKYTGKDGKVDFINQTGNLKLDISLEWRTKLFWKFHGAAFIDAGNIWNIRSYENQDEGTFRFHSFYKQIAVSYGLGLRFNFDYFVLRLDAGMKAINPAFDSTREHYAVLHPNFSRDFAFHFAVGLPF